MRLKRIRNTVLMDTLSVSYGTGGRLRARSAVVRPTSTGGGGRPTVRFRRAAPTADAVSVSIRCRDGAVDHSAATTAVVAAAAVAIRRRRVAVTAAAVVVVVVFREPKRVRLARAATAVVRRRRTCVSTATARQSVRAIG